eukprot:6214372-Pleurochrysis_carterae.AAC.3
MHKVSTCIENKSFGCAASIACPSGEVGRRACLVDPTNLSSRNVLGQRKVESELFAPVRAGTRRNKRASPLHPVLPELLRLPNCIQPAMSRQHSYPVLNSPRTLLQKEERVLDVTVSSHAPRPVGEAVEMLSAVPLRERVRKVAATLFRELVQQLLHAVACALQCELVLAFHRLHRLLVVALNRSHQHVLADQLRLKRLHAPLLIEDALFLAVDLAVQPLRVHLFRLELLVTRRQQLLVLLELHVSLSQLLVACL